MTAIGDLRPNRPEEFSGSFTISFAPVSGNVVPSGEASLLAASGAKVSVGP
jgi:hypothetical protein